MDCCVNSKQCSLLTDGAIDGAQHYVEVVTSQDRIMPLVQALFLNDLTPRGQRPKPANWGSMTKAQRENWRMNALKSTKGKRR